MPNHYFVTILINLANYCLQKYVYFVNNKINLIFNFKSGANRCNA